MARIRTIKPEFWTHEGLSSLPESTHLLAAALLNYADDEGYLNANPALIRAACCPLREPSVSIQDSLTMLSNLGYLEFGNGSDGRRFGRIMAFDTHQRVNRPTPSKIRRLQVSWPPSMNMHGGFTEPSPLEGNREQGREQGTGKGVSAREAELATESQIFEHWQRIRAIYPVPLRANWITAEKAARELVLAGEARWDYLESQVGLYAAQVRATGLQSMNPARFFTAIDMPWSQPWPLPKSKAQQAQDAGIAAAQTWVEGEHGNA